MKRCFLILAFIFVAQPWYKVISAEGAELPSVSAASQEEDRAEVKKVIENYLQCFNKQDFDCAISNVSKSFSGVVAGKQKDYEEFKVFIERFITNMTHLSISKPKVTDLKIEGSKANISVEYNVKAFDVNKAADFERAAKVKYFLLKEDGGWKIVSVETS